MCVLSFFLSSYVCLCELLRERKLEFLRNALTGQVRKGTGKGMESGGINENEE